MLFEKILQFSIQTRPTFPISYIRWTFMTWFRLNTIMKFVFSILFMNNQSFCEIYQIIIIFLFRPSLLINELTVPFAVYAINSVFWILNVQWSFDSNKITTFARAPRFNSFSGFCWFPDFNVSGTVSFLRRVSDSRSIFFLKQTSGQSW